MSFNTSPGRAEYTASTGQTIFPFVFKIFNDSDIKVYQTPDGSNPDDTNDLLILTTDYTVIIDGDAGGQITLVSAANSGDAITLLRDLPVTREVEYQTSGDLLAETLNDDQEYQTYLLADNKGVSDRTLVFPESTQNMDNVLPIPEALKLLRWRSDEKAIENTVITDDGVFVNIFNINTIAELSTVNPDIYSTVNVRGYHAANDGGGDLFNYDVSQSAVNNGGTIINGWIRQFTDAINTKWFGTKGNGTTDDTVAIQNAISAAGKGTVHIPTGTYLLSSSLVVPNGTSITGDANGTILLMSASGTFTNDFCILINSTDGSSWEVSYPGINSGKVEFIKIYTDNYVNAYKGIFVASSYKIENIRGDYLHSTIVSVSSYLDMLYINQILCGYGGDSAYQVVINALGDGLFINSIHCHQGATKSLYVNKCAGGLITGSINGDIELLDCSALKISGVHNEFGKVIIDNSSVSLENSYFWDNDEIAIEFLSTSGGKTTCSLRDIAFKYRLDDTDNSTLKDYNIKLISGTTVLISNVSRQILKTGALTITSTAGILVADSLEVLLDNFNDHSYFLSEDSFIGYDYKVELNKQLFHNDATFYPFSDIALNSNITWKKPSNTYYYDVVILRDKTRYIGRIGADGGRNIAITLDGNGVLLTLGTSNNNPNSFYRVYRGTTDNSYTEYVDIPFIASREFYDDGETLNGFKWKTRSAADVDSVNTGVKTVFNGDSVEFHRTSVPTAGTWKAGDKIINPSPSAGGTIGWVCVTAGSPGTWKTYGAIQA